MRFCLILFVCLLAFSSSAFAAVPQTINYQGYLASSGAAVDGSVDMVFTIYDAASSGNSLWTEVQTVQVNNGIYAVALGSVTPIDPAVIDGDLWLGVKVGSDAEMTPRQKLNSVSFAMRANTADSLAPGSHEDSICALYDELAKPAPDFCDKIQAGLADNSDGTVSNIDSGLMWQQGRYNGSTTSLSEYIQACANMSLGGYTDWRLPTFDELSELIDVRYVSPSLDPAFSDPNTVQKYFTYTTGLSGFNYVRFDVPVAGGSSSNSSSALAKCVRSLNQEVRYVDNGDETVSDTVTGRMWQKGRYNGSTTSLSEYIQACSNLSLGGYTDWRLPTFDELSELIDVRYVSPSLDPAFSDPNTVQKYFTYTTGLSGFNYVRFDVPVAGGSSSNSSSALAKCVR